MRSSMLCKPRVIGAHDELPPRGRKIFEAHDATSHVDGAAVSRKRDPNWLRVRSTCCQERCDESKRQAHLAHH